MAATHVVALFLPNTLKFEKGSSEAASLSLASEEAETASVAAGSRLLGLPQRSRSTVSLTATTPPLTPSVANQEFFAPMEDETTNRQFATVGDPRSLVQNDADAPAWGIDQPFNQPRSTAAPLPSGSILDFDTVHEELVEQQARLSIQIPTSSPSTRPTSNERSERSRTWTVEPPVHGNGALTNAFRAYASTSKIEICWIGTLGFPTDSLTKQTRQEISDHLVNEYNCGVVYASDKNVEGHYSGYCKTILWPTLHYHIPDSPKSKAYCDHSWSFYERVNQAFADKVVDSYKKGDMIWVHDYHLFLVPGMIRQQIPDAQIGFFLHTAFPSSEVFRTIPKSHELLQGVLGANLVSFQTEEHLNHFLQTCNRALTVETMRDGVKFDERFVNVAIQPIGINPSALRKARAEDEEVQDWIDTLRDRFPGKKLIVSRAKLDPIHGIRETLLAYELFLNKYPEFHEKTVLIQVATSSTEFSGHLGFVTSICARIDKKYASLTNTPLVFLKQDIPFSHYLALLSSGDVLINCALRDGMNLTSAEYIHCQDGLLGRKKHGPLILSEFTGSSTILHGQITINPWDYHQIAAAMKQALEMNEDEKEQRWNRLHQTISRYTGKHWAEELSYKLEKVFDEQHQRTATSVPRLSIDQMDKKYMSTTRRFFLFDLEGTLTNYKDDVGGKLTSWEESQRIIMTINKLSRDPRNTVYVMSARSTKELDKIFWYGTRIGLIAENGCFIRNIPEEPNHPIWEALVDLDQVQTWKKAVRSTLEHFQEIMEGAEIEDRQCSFIYDYEKVKDQDSASRKAGELAEQISGNCKSMAVHAVPIGKTILIEHSDVNKAFAASKIFHALYIDGHEGNSGAPDFVMVVGDSREDEVAFTWANNLEKHGIVPNVYTVSMGRRNTGAKASLSGGPMGLHMIISNFSCCSVREWPEEDWGWYKAEKKRRNRKIFFIGDEDEKHVDEKDGDEKDAEEGKVEET